ncbi:hypothetical protein [Nocardia sp. NPDC004415]
MYTPPRQLTRDEYTALPPAERVAAVRDGRADTVLGRVHTAATRLSDYSDDHQFTLTEYRSMPAEDRVAAGRAGRLANIFNPATQEN